jgi:membrane protein
MGFGPLGLPISRFVVHASSSNRAHSPEWYASQENSRRFYPHLLKIIWADVQTDDCLDLAAQMSFYIALSLFPFLLVIAAVIGWLPSTSLWHDFAQWITNYLPADSRKLVFSTILDLTHGYSGFFSLGLLGTIWAASAGVSSLIDSLNVTYGVKETRSFWKRRAIALTGTGLAAFFFIASFCILAFGHWAASLYLDLNGTHALRVPCEIARWLATLLLICLALDLMNYFLPNITRPWRWLTLGRLFVSLTLVGASIAFNFYLRYFANYPKLYGALAGFIALMIWIYIASLILLIGVEMDNALELRKKRGESA